MHTEDLTECSSWPTDTTFGCAGGDWKKLDGNMDESMTASCELLCRNERTIGCCYLSDAAGCHWRAGGQVDALGTGLSVNCNLKGI